MQKKKAGFLHKSGGNRITRIINDNSGAAMIFVLIVSAVVFTFCLSLLLVTYTLFSQTSRQTTQVQCKMMAQTFSESFGEELKDENSEICRYLEEQIRNGSWVSEETPEVDMASGSVKELVLNLDDSESTGDYDLSVKLTYSVNTVEDDESETETDDDDQDDMETKSGAGDDDSRIPVPGRTDENADRNPGNGTYRITASIRCVRGTVSDRDARSYTIETVYPAVTLVIG